MIKESAGMATEPPDGALRAPRGALSRMGWISWSHLLNDGCAFYLPAVLPRILVALHKPVEMAGVIVGALYVWQTLQPLAGVWADNVGGPWFITLGLLGTLCGAGLVGLATNMGMLVFFLMVAGIGSAVFHPSALKAARTTLHDRPGLGLSIFLVGGEIGRGSWPLFAGILVAWFGLKALCFVALPGLLTLYFVYHALPDMPPRPAHAEKIRWRRHVGPVALLMAFSATRAVVMYGVTTFVPILWHSRGGKLVGGASLLTTMLIVGIIGNLSGGALVDRFGRRPVLIVSSFLLIFLTPSFLFVHGEMMWVAAGLFGIALFSTFSATLLIGQDIFPENRALGSGIALGLSNATGALLLMPLGFIAHHGHYNRLFWIFSGMAVLMFCFAFTLGPRLTAPHPAR